MARFLFALSLAFAGLAWILSRIRAEDPELWRAAFDEPYGET